MRFVAKYQKKVGIYYKGHFYENKTKKTFSPTLSENELCIKKSNALGTAMQ